MSHTYKDFATGKIRRTNGKFAGWTNRTGPLSTNYAIFRTPKTRVFVPAYLLTKETKAAIANTEKGRAGK